MNGFWWFRRDAVWEQITVMLCSMTVRSLFNLKSSMCHFSKGFRVAFVPPQPADEQNHQA